MGLESVGRAHSLHPGRHPLWLLEVPSQVTASLPLGLNVQLTCRPRLSRPNAEPPAVTFWRRGLMSSGMTETLPRTRAAVLNPTAA